LTVIGVLKLNVCDNIIPAKSNAFLTFAHSVVPAEHDREILKAFVPVARFDVLEANGLQERSVFIHETDDRIPSLLLSHSTGTCLFLLSGSILS